MSLKAKQQRAKAWRFGVGLLVLLIVIAIVGMAILAIELKDLNI
jgi:hypothetical protein